MKRFKNILFVADREDGLGVALDRAVALAGSNGARLTVMDVVPEIGIADYIKRTYSVDLNAQLGSQRLEFLEGLTKSYADSGVPIYTTVACGTPFIEVVRAVRRNHHDLVIKVAQHDAGLPGPLFGSTDMHLLRKCPCPVWIDRPGQQPVYHRILAAVDPFDDESGDLQRLILDLATSLTAREHAELEVVHTWRLPGESMLANGRGRIPLDELTQLLDATETKHRRALDDLLSGYGLSSDAKGVHLSKGRAAQVISDLSRERQIDLIVMGTLGRAGIAGLFIGNTAEDVLRETGTAVLAVKPPGFRTPIT